MHFYSNRISSIRLEYFLIMKIEEEIKQKSFRNEYQKSLLILFLLMDGCLISREDFLRIMA